MAVLLCIISMTTVWAKMEGASIDKEDGSYKIEVTMEGGSGRASILSPAVMVVKNGKAYARIEWSSSNYDYMIVNEEKYLPVNEDGNSVFEIPILVFNEPMKVVADTTAMSVPHEIPYTLTFDMKSISGENAFSQNTSMPGCILVIAICFVGVFIKMKKKKGNNG